MEVPNRRLQHYGAENAPRLRRVVVPERMKSTGYRLIMCEALTGILVDPNGGRLAHGNEEDLPVFVDLAAVTAARDEFLARVPWCEAWIKNLTTGEVGERVLSPHYPEYEKQHVEWNRWQDTPLLVRLFKKKPETPLVAQQMGAR